MAQSHSDRRAVPDCRYARASASTPPHTLFSSEQGTSPASPSSFFSVNAVPLSAQHGAAASGAASLALREQLRSLTPYRPRLEKTRV